MPYEINFIDEFEEWWSTLSAEQQEDITARIDLLAGHGPLLGRPTVERIVSSAFHNMKELRCSSDGALRVLFVFDPRGEAILLVGGDKTGDWNEWYERNVPLADSIYARYLRDLREEGVI